MDRLATPNTGLLWIAMRLISTVAQAADDDRLQAPGPPAQEIIQQRLIIPAPQVLDVESLIFGRDIPAAKERLDRSIAESIEEACRGYDLPEQIRHRIELAAQVDKLRLFRKIEELRQISEQTGNEIRQQRPVMGQIQVLRKQQANLLDRDSFFVKSRKSLLARVPSINPEMTIDKMKRGRHRSNVEKALQVIGREAFITEDLYTQFVERVFEETLPEEPFEFRDLPLVQYRIGLMPRNTLEPLFAKDQWARTSKILANFQEKRQFLLNERVLNNKKEFEQPLLVKHEEKAVHVIPEPLVNQRGAERRNPVMAVTRVAPIVDPAFLLTRHRANIDSAVRAIERQVRLRPEQRTALTELLLKEVPPPQVFGKFDDLVVQYSFSQLSDEQLKPIFDEDQWPKVLHVFASIDQYRAMLKVHGLIHKPSTRQFPVQAADATLPSNRAKD